MTAARFIAMCQEAAQDDACAARSLLEHCRSIKTLVVEDDQHYSAILRAMLVSIPEVQYEVTTAGSISEAIGKLVLARFDLILLDLRLPNGEGVATYRRLANAVPLVAPVVVITAIPSEEDRFKLLSLGAQDYISKEDVTPRALSRIALSAIARHRGMSRQVVQRTEALTRGWREQQFGSGAEEAGS